MKTYYILDTDTNTWSQEHRPLKEIMSMPGITGGHLLADARSRQTLTVAQALVSSRRAVALKAPSVPLLKLPSAAPSPAGEPAQKSAVNKQSTPAMPIRKIRKYCEYKVLGAHDECFGDQFNAAAPELVLNSLAQRGWRVLCCLPPIAD